jgi:hypothetical protein
MNCEIIQFSTARLSAKRVDEIEASTRAIVAGPIFVRRRERPLPEPLTETCKNQRLRDARRDRWWAASRLTAYWRGRMDWHSALQCAQTHGVADSDRFPAAEDEDWMTLVTAWRTSLVKQLLTPAPDVGAVTWKRTQLAGEQYAHVGVKRERIERAIADDVAFLEAHPTRRSIAASRQFKEAMRQRIKDIAASRDLSAEDIKGVMTLKHHEIAEFTEKHGVNIEWLLEGKGRIFTKDVLTGEEFATVVATLPLADQQEILAKMREMNKGRP